MPEGEAHEWQVDLTLNDLHRALDSYAKTYKTGFARSLDMLGPAPEWFHPTAEHSGLAFPGYSHLLQDNDQKEFTYQGYRYSYAPEPADAHGAIAGYALKARPIQFGKTGTRSFLTEANGVIHATSEDRAATREDAATQK